MPAIFAVLGGLSAIGAAFCAWYAASHARPAALRELSEAVLELSATVPAGVQRMETLRDAAAADLEEAQRQRQRAQNTRNRDGKTNQPATPATRAEVIDMVRERYQRGS